MDIPPGYRSATEYCFEEDQADAIARTSAYHRRDFCLAVIWFSPREHVNIRPSIATPFQRSATVGLGSLDRLPLELLLDTLYRLDMYSMFRFRQINRRSRHMVDSLSQYQRAVVHGLNLFCALLRTRLAIDISLLDFYNALCTKACALCGEFGGFISLLVWKRCCFKCLKNSPETQVRTLASLRKQFQMTRYEINQLRTFRSLPGVYSMNESAYKARVALVSLHQASLVCRHAPVQEQPENFDRNQKFNFMGSCALPYYDKQTGKVERGISCAGCQLAVEKDIVSVKGTRLEYEARDKVYAQDGFLEHFRWCEQAQLLWKSSGEGDHRPPELPVSARTGGYFRRRE
ncbi:hypothetical protein ASPZODRAFT_15076 [Penicilliopsis zonata CBS 506.65]|uniref:F-box domain-containing protein n=1 Tax=Penicilliopsis zonata CBS 506.65 TaxID=1073090 RepID=A0A1L9SKN6_9EURO|nr:hypothetical protein ASPZODRAFT_15076 [Penicilliopsis zonata CBS 506.65]OJJ47624.1 hypothetical protein ASPZODRAFT_15076 [Penicilliopsis zonata CBS 506.65]